MNPLDESFYDLLEFHITRSLSLSENPACKGFWCDGILPTDMDSVLLTDQIQRHRSILLAAFIGKTGQDRYSLKLHFGPKSLSRLSRNLDLKGCLPPESDAEGIACDPAQQTIDVFLL
jgi:hypothetical protein